MEVEGLKLDFLGHSGFLLDYKGRKIAIDPYNLSANVKDKVDMILITHSHYDHCSIQDINKLVKPGTVMVVPADVQSKITRIEGIAMQVIEEGDELEFGKIKIEAFPAYNIDKSFHGKNDGWLGYLIKMDGMVVYHSGDSDNIPEMQKLSGYGKHGNYFIAILPVSGKYVMTPEEAFKVAKMIKPDLVVPMHYGSGIVGTIEDARSFVELCEGAGINSKILEKI